MIVELIIINRNASQKNHTINQSRLTSRQKLRQKKKKKQKKSRIIRNLHLQSFEISPP